MLVRSLVILSNRMDTTNPMLIFFKKIIFFFRKFKIFILSVYLPSVTKGHNAIKNAIRSEIVHDNKTFLP